MICAWKELLAILPQWLQSELSESDAETLREIRLRLSCPVEFVRNDTSQWIPRMVSTEDIDFCINAASKYSPWASASIHNGYITAEGGHRIGICGDAVVKDGNLSGFRNITSLCIRIAKDYPGIIDGHIIQNHSTLILGAPGCGKTTLLRDSLRRISEHHAVCVIDERGELFPKGIQRGRRMDVISNCGKKQGIENALRTMGPEWIGVDEITSPEDCLSILNAHGCGVHLIATAHASGIEDFRTRSVYRPLTEIGVFHTFLVLNKMCRFTVVRSAA